MNRAYVISLFGWSFETPLRQSVVPLNTVTAMSTEPRFKCGQCKKLKLRNEYGTRQTGNNHDQEGSRFATCLSCSAANSSNRKRKRANCDPGHPAKRLATETPTSPSEFVDALAKHASASEIDDSWRVSLEEMTLTGKDIADHIASLAHKATGYRFR